MNFFFFQLETIFLFKNQIPNHLFRKCIRDFSSIINKKFKKFFCEEIQRKTIFFLNYQILLQYAKSVDFYWK